MGEEYQKSLLKIPKTQKKRFLEEDWRAHMMLLELYEKYKGFDQDFEAFCDKLFSVIKEEIVDDIPCSSGSRKSRIIEEIKIDDDQHANNGSLVDDNNNNKCLSVSGLHLSFEFALI